MAGKPVAPAAATTCGESSWSGVRGHLCEQLAELVDAVPDGSVITLQSKEYALKDTLTIEKPLTLRGSGASSRLSVFSSKPYKSVIKCSSGPIHLQGFSVTHSSPSVANNYAVYLVDANEVSLEDLDIQSETGTGIAIEGGGKVLVKDCVIHDCASNGIGIFSNIVGDDASNTAIQGTRIIRNGRNGVLIKGAGSPLLESIVLNPTGNMVSTLQIQNHA
eukprot:jgi/Picre1/35212/NNA_002674.t1